MMIVIFDTPASSLSVYCPIQQRSWFCSDRRIGIEKEKRNQNREKNFKKISEKGLFLYPPVGIKSQPNPRMRRYGPKKQISLVSTVLIYLLHLTKVFAKSTSPWWSRSPDPIAWLCYFLPPPRWNLFMMDWSRSLSKNFILLCKTAKKKIN